MRDLGLDPEEQDRVRTALKFLRIQTGSWAALAKILRFSETTLQHQTKLKNPKRVSETVAFRVAKLAGVSMDALLRGEYPAKGACPYCGRGGDSSAG